MERQKILSNVNSVLGPDFGETKLLSPKSSERRHDSTGDVGAGTWGKWLFGERPYVEKTWTSWTNGSQKTVNHDVQFLH